MPPCGRTRGRLHGSTCVRRSSSGCPSRRREAGRSPGRAPASSSHHALPGVDAVDAGDGRDHPLPRPRLLACGRERGRGAAAGRSWRGAFLPLLARGAAPGPAPTRARPPPRARKAVAIARRRCGADIGVPLYALSSLSMSRGGLYGEAIPLIARRLLELLARARRSARARSVYAMAAWTNFHLGGVPPMPPPAPPRAGSAARACRPWACTRSPGSSWRNFASVLTGTSSRAVSGTPEDGLELRRPGPAVLSPREPCRSWA